MTTNLFFLELKAIKHYKNNLTISSKGIDAFLETGSVPAPLTIYNEVSSLLPGHYLVIRDQKLEISEYWSFNNLFTENSSLITDPSSLFPAHSSLITDSSSLITDHSSLITEQKYDNDAKKKIRTALLDSVRSHLVSDVEVGAFYPAELIPLQLYRLCGRLDRKK
ncbi:MAG: hypothetical protein IPJ23_03965 [Ignavibacteriales bacterium]|nr:hypothetical protein [Ignavibacteriales bacterium]